jgi:molybdopterin/thiamine biosynthesis adenylyltransferase
MEGYVTTIIPGETPCLNCLNLQSKDWNLPFPVLGAIPAVMGSMAALEAVKVLTGYGTPLKNKMLMFDGKTSSFRTIKLRRNPNCKLCGHYHE